MQRPLRRAHTAQSWQTAELAFFLKWLWFHETRCARRRSVHSHSCEIIRLFRHNWVPEILLVLLSFLLTDRYRLEWLRGLLLCWLIIPRIIVKGERGVWDQSISELQRGCRWLLRQLLLQILSAGWRWRGVFLGWRGVEASTLREDDSCVLSETWHMHNIERREGVAWFHRINYYLTLIIEPGMLL